MPQEHCLMGIRGQVKRSTDGHVIHANVDTDVIVTEEPPVGSTRKPDELYGIVERFCLGMRRLELFGEDHNLRPGWVTVGSDITTPNFSPQAYARLFAWPDGSPFIECQGPKPAKGQPNLLRVTEQIERMRPKSPT